MSGKNMKALRRAAGFKPKQERSYQKLLIPKEMDVLRYNSETKEITTGRRTVEQELIECTDPPRKVYQALKDSFKGKGETEFNRLPSKGELNDISKEIVSQERVSAVIGGNIPNENREDGGEEN